MINDTKAIDIDINNIMDHQNKSIYSYDFLLNRLYQQHKYSSNVNLEDDTKEKKKSTKLKNHTQTIIVNFPQLDKLLKISFGFRR